MHVFKYKPMDKLTIDFLIKKCPQKLLGIKPYIRGANEHLYILFCGINKNAYYALSMQLIKYYEEMFPGITKANEYFPIQFETSDCIYAHIYKSKDENIDGEVGEFRLKNVGGNEEEAKNYIPEWELVRIREDRRADVIHGSYFGNNYRVAELIWFNYKYPIIIEETKQIDAGYFVSHESMKHKAIRNFNSFVKSNVFATFSDTDWVLDLASGKGQDLARYRDNRVRNLLCLEIDQTAIIELISRKHDLVMRKKHQFDNRSKYNQPENDFHKGIKVLVNQMDLNNKYTDNIQQLERLPINTFNIIVCDFAFHYFLANKAALKNIIKFITHYLKPGGRFIFMSFDGAAVNNLLKNGDYINDKFGIKKLYKGHILLPIGQKISAKLPVNDTAFIEEYLVNIDYIEEEFKAVKMELEADEPFSKYLDKFKHENLDDIDKQFVSLYHVYIFYKKI
jgi:SAM-dependent methyltransferase